MLLVAERDSPKSVSPAQPGFHALYGLGISAALLVLAVALTVVLRPHPGYGALPGFLFLFAIWAAAWWGGYVPGLLICTAAFLLVPSLRAGRVAAPGAPTLPFITLVVTCVLISRLASSRIKTERVLRADNEQLEIKVHERTLALELANTELQHQLAQLEALYGELLFGLGFLDTELRYIRVNEKLATIHGKPVHAHFGQSFRDMAPPLLADVVEPLYKQVLETGEPMLDREFGGFTNGDAESYWSLACAPVRTATREVIGIQVILQDVTERKRAERALSQANEKLRQANGDLEQFAYSASHDLQEPLRMVSIYSQMLQKKFAPQLGPLGQEFIQYTVDGSNRMAQLVADLLAYTRASTWDFDSMGTVDPNESIDRAVANLQLAIEQAGASIGRGPLPQVEMHSFHLDQVFQNLISNAVKYRGSEPPRITINAERGQNEWLFSVKDNGIGIDSQYKEQIFGVFKRLHTAAEFSGTGIGLAICQRIIERRGGRLWVESEPGKGSTFFFTLPDVWEH